MLDFTTLNLSFGRIRAQTGSMICLRMDRTIPLATDFDVLTSERCRRAWWAFGLAWVAVPALPSFANAASWLGYKNDTGSPVIIQSAIIVNSQLRWQKPHSLFPGEVAWDAIAAPGPRVIGVFDPKQNNRLIYQEGVTIGVAESSCRCRWSSRRHRGVNPLSRPNRNSSSLGRPRIRRAYRELDRTRRVRRKTRRARPRQALRPIPSRPRIRRRTRLRANRGENTHHFIAAASSARYSALADMTPS